MGLFERLRADLERRKAQGNYRELPLISYRKDNILFDSSSYIDLASNDYLCVARDSSFINQFFETFTDKEASGSQYAQQILSNFINSGSTGSRLLTGNQLAYTYCEDLLASLFSRSVACPWSPDGSIPKNGIGHNRTATDALIKRKAMYSSTYGQPYGQFDSQAEDQYERRHTLKKEQEGSNLSFTQYAADLEAQRQATQDDVKSDFKNHHPASQDFNQSGSDHRAHASANATAQATHAPFSADTTTTNVMTTAGLVPTNATAHVPAHAKVNAQANAHVNAEAMAEVASKQVAANADNAAKTSYVMDDSYGLNQHYLASETILAEKYGADKPSSKTAFNPASHHERGHAADIQGNAANHILAQHGVNQVQVPDSAYNQEAAHNHTTNSHNTNTLADELNSGKFLHSVKEAYAFAALSQHQRESEGGAGHLAHGHAAHHASAEHSGLSAPGGHGTSGSTNEPATAQGHLARESLVAAKQSDEGTDAAASVNKIMASASEVKAAETLDKLHAVSGGVDSRHGKVDFDIAAMAMSSTEAQAHARELAGTLGAGLNLGRGSDLSSRISTDVGPGADCCQGMASNQGVGGQADKTDLGIGQSKEAGLEADTGMHFEAGFGKGAGVNAVNSDEYWVEREQNNLAGVGLNTLDQQAMARDCLYLNSGFDANYGILATLFGENDLLLVDKLAHASIIDGMLQAKAKTLRFAHNDMEHLERLLKSHAHKYENVVIVTEAVFSMDGDRAKLKEIVALKHQYANVLIYVDEAHSFGVLGEGGLGLCQELQLLDEVDFIMGTLSKAIGSQGAFLICPRIVKQYLVNYMRNFIYSTALPPLNVAFSMYIVGLLNTTVMQYRRDYLNKICNYLHLNLLEMDLTPSESQIQPLITGDNDKAVYMSEVFKRSGLLALPIRHPTVPLNKVRLRITLNCNLRIDDVDLICSLIRRYRNMFVG